MPLALVQARRPPPARSRSASGPRPHARTSGFISAARARAQASPLSKLVSPVLAVLARLAAPRSPHNRELRLRQTVAAAVAGALSAFMVHPVETIKIRIQAVPGNAARPSLLNLYNGIAASILAMAPTTALKVFFREELNDRLPALHQLNDALGAALGDLASAAVRVPCETVKQRLQVTPVHGFRDFLQAGRFLLRTEGLKGLYENVPATLWHDIPFSSLEFCLFGLFKSEYMRRTGKKRIRPQESLSLGMASGAGAAYLSTPFDVIKTRLLTQSPSTPLAQRYTSVTNCFLRVAKEEGLPGLFAGAPARVLWIAPLAGSFFAFYELCLHLGQSPKVAVPQPNSS